jgi:acid phosphatase type 7
MLAWYRFRPPAVTAPRAAGPDFHVNAQDLSNPLQIVAYGDMRFTHPSETEATNPKVRRWLVDRIAAEKPDAVLLSGDIPWHGSHAGDYEEYRAETKIWRDAHLRVYPALGNHEFSGLEKQCLENWWSAFPELRGLRYYSVQLGDLVYVLNLDSNSSLTPASEQIAWVSKQLANLPATVSFVLLNLHHPPVVDVQNDGDDSHNGRPNEADLAKFLATAARNSRARFIVVAGHIHNYERFYQDGIVYLVSGGGGAKPRPVVRESKDLYRDQGFPNYHYVKLVVNAAKLDGTMIRVSDPGASAPHWEEKDRFEVLAGSR